MIWSCSFHSLLPFLSKKKEKVLVSVADLLLLLLRFTFTCSPLLHSVILLSQDSLKAILCFALFFSVTRHETIIDWREMTVCAKTRREKADGNHPLMIGRTICASDFFLFCNISYRFFSQKAAATTHAWASSTSMMMMREQLLTWPLHASWKVIVASKKGMYSDVAERGVVIGAEGSLLNYLLSLQTHTDRELYQVAVHFGEKAVPFRDHFR